MVRKNKIKKVAGVQISTIVARVCRLDHVLMCFYSQYQSGSFDLLDKDHTWMRVLQRKTRWVEFGGRRYPALSLLSISYLRDFTVKLAGLGRSKRMQLDNHQDLGFLVDCVMLRIYFSQQQDNCEEGHEAVIRSDTEITFVKKASKFGIIALLILGAVHK